MEKYYTDSDIGLSVEDLSSTVFDVLTSPKMDEELQNDVIMTITVVKGIATTK